MKIAHVFPGQGAQYSGMGKDLHDQYPLAQQLFAQADAILGFPLSEIMFTGSEEELKQTRVTQPAVFLHAYVAHRCLAGEQPDMVAGHSLGELTALVVNGCLSFEEGLTLVSKRAHAMQRACERQASGMVAVLKFDDKVTEEVCASVADDVVVPANYNSPQQLVISGSLTGLEKAQERLRRGRCQAAAAAQRGRGVPLAADAARPGGTGRGHPAVPLPATLLPRLSERHRHGLL